MFAARVNQENAIYEQQTAAAAKPLNQGVKGLGVKTPGNKANAKTPFKAQLHNENDAFGAGKAGGKGRGGGLSNDRKTGNLDQSAFVTPAGPRTRAPLGNKTTNAKGNAVQTPGLKLQDAPASTRPTSPRLRRAKIKVLEAESDGESEDAEEREIEYMPPREVPLPDHPDDWPIDRTYPQFEGANLTRGWWLEFGRKKISSDDEEEDEFSDLEEKLKQIEARDMQKQRDAQAKKGTPAKNAILHKTTKDPLSSKAPQTLKSKAAASALSKPSQTIRNFASSTASTAARAATRVPLSATSKGTSTLVTNPRHTAAKVASKSTLGYSKGRVVSAGARGPFSGMTSKPKPETESKDAPSSAARGTGAPTSLEALFAVHYLQNAHETDDGQAQDFAAMSDDDEALKDFHFGPVET